MSTFHIISSPIMTIVAPADVDEIGRFMPLTVDHQGPIYIRLAKGFDPIVNTDGKLFQIGKPISMRDGTDALIVTTGITLKSTLAASDSLSEKEIDAGVPHVLTIKPLDTEANLDYAASVPVIATVEEHTVIGGRAARWQRLLPRPISTHPSG